jgi:hypothetical protein
LWVALLTDGAHVGAPLAREDSEPVRPTPDAFDFLETFFIQGGLDRWFKNFCRYRPHETASQSCGELRKAQYL